MTHVSMNKLILLKLLFLSFLGANAMNPQIPTDRGPQRFIPTFRENKDSAYMGVSNIYFENSFAIFGDSILIDVPKIFIDGKLVVCPCGKPAIGAVIRNGKCAAYCLDCAPRRGTMPGGNK